MSGGQQKVCVNSLKSYRLRDLAVPACVEARPQRCAAVIENRRPAQLRAVILVRLVRAIYWR